MRAFIWLVAAHWMLLHGPEHQSYWVNLDQVTTLRQPTAGDLRGSFPHGARCVVGTTDGKFVVVTESCKDIYQLMLTAR